MSHESALELLGLSDVVPEAVHLTLPRSRRYRPVRVGVKIHTTKRKLGPPDVVVRDGVRVTSPGRAILDAAEAGTAPEQVMRAVTQAVDRGIVTEPLLLAAAKERGGRAERLVRRALQEGHRS